MLQEVAGQLSKAQRSQLERFADKVARLGGNFAVCDCQGKLIIDRAGGKFITDWDAVKENFFSGLKTISRKENREISVVNESVLAGVLSWDGERPEFVAFIDTADKLNNEPGGGVCSQETKNVQAELNASEIVHDMLGLLVQKFNWETRAQRQAEKFTAELSQVYEELALIHRLSTNMKVSNTDANYLQLACDSLTEIVSVEGIAVLLEQDADEEDHMVLTAGSGIIDIDRQMASILQSRAADEIARGKEALLDSSAEAPFRYNWPEYIKSIIAIPLFGKQRMRTGFSDKVNDSNHIIGLMVGINRQGKPDFDSADLKLFNSVANGCAVFVENVRLFSDLRELFLGSLKALTSSIDAKDQYTRGHSERVAIIAQWIAQRYAEDNYLEPEQIHNIYLAGLLHDVGKIGIDESLLRKKGKLTEEEYNCIKKHSAIGAGILSQIKQMRDIVPGVLYHHERVDGRGYPDGLKGDNIPLSGKILGLADCFDAMTSARIYRGAMTVEQVTCEIRKGLGTQFDEKVGTVFLNSDLQHLWQIIQSQTADGHGTNALPEYPTQPLENLTG